MRRRCEPCRINARFNARSGCCRCPCEPPDARGGEHFRQVAEGKHIPVHPFVLRKRHPDEEPAVPEPRDLGFVEFVVNAVRGGGLQTQRQLDFGPGEGVRGVRPFDFVPFALEGSRGHAHIAHAGELEDAPFPPGPAPGLEVPVTALEPELDRLRFPGRLLPVRADIVELDDPALDHRRLERREDIFPPVAPAREVRLEPPIIALAEQRAQPRQQRVRVRIAHRLQAVQRGQDLLLLALGQHRLVQHEAVEQADTAAPALAHVDRDARSAQQLDVPVHGPHRGFEPLGKLLRGDRLPVQEDVHDLEQPVQPHPRSPEFHVLKRGGPRHRVRLHYCRKIRKPGTPGFLIHFACILNSRNRSL